jgi:hypothetical protein
VVGDSVDYSGHSAAYFAYFPSHLLLLLLLLWEGEKAKARESV